MEEYYLICKNCGKKIVCKNKNSFATLKSRIKLGKRSELCRKCVCNTKEWKEKQSKLNSGKNNPMSGKSVYSIWLQKYGKEQADRRYAEWKQKMNNRYSRFSQQEKQIFKQKSKRIGQKNGMYGKTPYDVWLQKYGKEEADRRYIEWRQKITKSSKRGKESHNYGKTPPVGSGNGWGGWYNGWYFRSIKELTYMICVIQKNGYEWESAENKKFAIQYQINGQSHIYYPDFFLNGHIIVEIKPRRLMNTEVNKIKFENGQRFAKENGYEYRVVDIKNMPKQQLVSLWLDGKVKFIQKYEERIKEICKSMKKKK